MTATPSTAAVLARICHERLPAWWNGLSDHQRKMLKGGSLPMSEWAFEAGVVAGLDAQAAALSAKDAEIARLRSALEPFAEGAKRYRAILSDEDDEYPVTGFTVGQLRKAKAALQTTEQETT